MRDSLRVIVIKKSGNKMELCRAFIFSLGVIFYMALLLFTLPPMSNRNRRSSGTSVILSEDMNIRTHDCRQDDENTYLWKIESKPPAYIFGFLDDGHKFDIIYETLSLNTKAALLHSEEVYIEKNHEIKEILNNANLQAKWNETLQDLLPTHIYRKLDPVLSGIVNETAIRNLNPGWVALGLHRLIVRAMANQWRSVEKITEKKEFAEGLLTSAKGIGKRVKDFETGDGTIETYNNMPFEHYVFWIQESLAKLEFSLSDNRSLRMNQNLEEYKCGQFEGIKTLFIRENAFEDWKMSAKNFNAYIKKGMVISQNKKMAARIKHLLFSKGKKRLFFAFDAGHLTGESGTTIVDILREDGFTISRVKKSDSQLDVLF